MGSAGTLSWTSYPIQAGLFFVRLCAFLLFGSHLILLFTHTHTVSLLAALQAFFWTVTERRFREMPFAMRSSSPMRSCRCQVRHLVSQKSRSHHLSLISTKRLCWAAYVFTLASLTPSLQMKFVQDRSQNQRHWSSTS